MADRVLGVLGVGLVDPDLPLLRVDDLGVLRGDACFETLRVHGGIAQDVEAHLARLTRSAARLDLPEQDLDQWRALIAEVVAGWTGPGEATLRLVLTRGVEGSGTPTAFALLSPLPDSIPRQRRHGVRVITLSRGTPADAHTDSPWLLGGVKSTSYAVNMAALRYAQAVGADDVIFVSTDGQVLEGPTATVVWAEADHLYTPPQDLGILAGTTVRTLFDRAGEQGLRAGVRSATVEDLHAADGLWLVSSVRGAVPVVALDGRERGDAGMTERIQAALGIPILPRAGHEPVRS